MTINVIKYYLDRGEYEEAERVLEEIIGCNGFCSNSNSNSKSKKGGCGCGK
jgi:pentatricopeptide repeat protein